MAYDLVIRGGRVVILQRVQGLIDHHGNHLFCSEALKNQINSTGLLFQQTETLEPESHIPCSSLPLTPLLSQSA
jgi:hypothetical protein